MYERFTDCSCKVMLLANQEARRLNHEYIGTEHILLGLIKKRSGIAANVLKNLDIDLHKVRLEVEKIVQSGPDMVTMGKLPQTPKAKKVIEYAIEEARNLQHNCVGTEHLLLGILRETEGVAAQALTNLGLRLEDVRQELLELLGFELEGTKDPIKKPKPLSNTTSGWNKLPNTVEQTRNVYDLLREKIVDIVMADYSAGRPALETINELTELLRFKLDKKD